MASNFGAVVLVLLTSYPILYPSYALATDPGPAGVQQLQDLIQRVISLIVGLAFIALLIMLIYSGIRFLTSGGDQKAIASASQSMTWAVLGIAFMVLAWLILKLIEAFTGVQVTRFCLGFGCTP